MGYFSNSTEGMIFEEMYCRDCVHYEYGNKLYDAGCCPVWMLHLLYNYDAVGNETLQHILNTFIPERTDQPGNEPCTMRYVAEPQNADTLTSQCVDAIKAFADRVEHRAEGYVMATGNPAGCRLRAMHDELALLLGEDESTWPSSHENNPYEQGDPT